MFLNFKLISSVICFPFIYISMLFLLFSMFLLFSVFLPSYCFLYFYQLPGYTDIRVYNFLKIISCVPLKLKLFKLQTLFFNNSFYTYYNSTPKSSTSPPPPSIILCLTSIISIISFTAFLHSISIPSPSCTCFNLIRYSS